MRRISVRLVLVSVLSFLVSCVPAGDEHPGAEMFMSPKIGTSSTYEIFLDSGVFTPVAGDYSLIESRKKSGIVQFWSTPIEHADLASLGIHVDGYLPRNAFRVSFLKELSVGDLQNLGIRSAFSLRPYQKIEPGILHDAQEFSADNLSLSVSYASIVSSDDIHREVQALGGNIVELSPSSTNMHVSIPGSSVRSLAEFDWIWWIERQLQPTSKLDEATFLIGADNVQSPPWGSGSLSGAGVAIGQWEPGTPDPSHPDFGDRVLVSEVAPGDPVSFHATGVAGIMVGNGALDIAYAGVAPESSIVAWWSNSVGFEQELLASYEGDSTLFLPPTLVTNHSWGSATAKTSTVYCSNMGRYGGDFTIPLDSTAVMAPITHVVAGGNDGSGNKEDTEEEYGVQYASDGVKCFPDVKVVPIDPPVPATLSEAYLARGFGSIYPPATAKNAIAVGAVTKGLDLARISSKGPTRDGRLKPDILAVGGCGVADDGDCTGNLMIETPEPGPGYGGWSVATSFTAPQVSGAVALLIERIREIEGDEALEPEPAVLKAVLLNSASSTRPSYGSGYGLIDLERAVDTIENVIVLDVTPDLPQNFTIPAPETASCGLKVMAVWTDPAASEGALLTLVNDIDMLLASTSGSIFRSWGLTPAMPDVQASAVGNVRDNVEQIFIEAPFGPTFGALSGAKMPTTDPQTVAVHWVYEDCDGGASDGGSGDDDDDSDGGTDAGGGTGGGGGGCDCESNASRANSLVAWAVVFLVGWRRRRRRVLSDNSA